MSEEQDKIVSGKITINTAITIGGFFSVIIAVISTAISLTHQADAVNYKIDAQGVQIQVVKDSTAELKQGQSLSHQNMKELSDRIGNVEKTVAVIQDRQSKEHQ